MPRLHCAYGCASFLMQAVRAGRQAPRVVGCAAGRAPWPADADQHAGISDGPGGAAVDAEMTAAPIYCYFCLLTVSASQMPRQF